MKIFTYEVKRDECDVKYIIKAETKEEAIKKISKISGEKVTKVKEI